MDPLQGIDDNSPDSTDHPLRRKRYAGGIPARAQALVEVFLVSLGGPIAVLVLAQLLLGDTDPMSSISTLFRLLMAEALITVALIFWFLRSAEEDLGALGWMRGSNFREVLIGLLAVPASIGAVIVVGQLFRAFFPDFVTDINPLLDLIQTRQDVILLLISSIFVGGFKEELQRAFVLQRFHHYLGGVWPGLLIWTVFFGVGHLNQGVDNATAAAVLGLIFGLLYIWRGSLTAPIVAHALFDIVMVSLYWFMFR